MQESVGSGLDREFFIIMQKVERHVNSNDCINPGAAVPSIQIHVGFDRTQAGHAEWLQQLRLARGDGRSWL